MRWQLCGIGWWQAVCFCITQVCFSCVHPTRRWRFSSSAWVELSSNVYTMKVGCSSTRKFSLSLCYVTMFGKAPRSLTKPLDRLVHAQHTHTHARTGDGFNHRPTVAQSPPPLQSFHSSPSFISPFHPISVRPRTSTFHLVSNVSVWTSPLLFCWIAPSLTHNLKSKVKHGGVLPSSSSWPWLAGVELSYHRRTADEWLEQSSTLLSGCFTLNAAGHSHADVIVQKLKGADELAKERKGNYGCMIRVNI